jgi:hypothetical protein
MLFLGIWVPIFVAVPVNDLLHHFFPLLKRVVFDV